MVNNDVLISSLNEIQLEYRDILVNCKEKLLSNNPFSVIDSINVFWYENKKLINTILKYIDKPYSSFVFTGASFLDLSDLEHFPFRTIGKYHFLDDPICKYTRTIGLPKNHKFVEEIKKQLELAIEDNIKIIEKCAEEVYILPISFLFDADPKLRFRAVEQAFFSLFDDEDMNNKKYSSLKTPEDVLAKLSPGVEKQIILSEEDDFSLDFKTRLENYKNTTILPLEDTASDAEIFKFALFSYMLQAFDILLMCAQFQMAPYIRYSVCFKYTLHLSANFKGNSDISNMMLKSSVAYILYNCFDKSQIESIDFLKYCRLINEFDISNKIFREIYKYNITYESLNVNKVQEIIMHNLTDMFKKLK